jgi:hypothetical protein
MTLDLSTQFNPVPKPCHGRNKPLARTRGAISSKVRKVLAKRSQGVCERCKRQGVPLQAAHTTRRWQLDRTTSSVLAHLCVPCHLWADNSAEGREWLTAFQTKLLEESS